MKWGLIFSSTKCPEPERAVALARAAEEAGFESLWAPEHVAIPASYSSRYGFAEDGKIGLADQDLPDPVVWLAHVAAVTSTIRLATGILILPEHNPVVLAKSTATLAQLSGGRFVLGIGVGWLREEFEALGVPFDARGARTDEYIDVLRAIWRDTEATHRGRFVEFERIKSRPKPPGGTIPIHCGGDSAASARRAGRTADGYFPAMYPTSRVYEELPALLAEMRTAAQAAGRDPDLIEVTSGGVRTAQDASWFADHGVHRLTVTVRAREVDAVRDELMRFGEQVIEPTADL